MKQLKEGILENRASVGGALPSMHAPLRKRHSKIRKSGLDQGGCRGRKKDVINLPSDRHEEREITFAGAGVWPDARVRQRWVRPQRGRD